MKTIFSKKINIISAIVMVAIFTGMLAGCQSEFTSEFEAFEKELFNNISLEKDVVKLIGFTTHNISEDEKNHYKRLKSEYGEKLKQWNTVFSNDLSLYRIYFPLHTAIVEYNGKTYTADEKGVVSIPDLTDISQIKVIGRKRSETVHGCGSNIIEEDRILLKDALIHEVKNGVYTAYFIDENVCIFDFEAFNMHRACCSTTIEGEIPRLKDGVEACYDNHGGWNCTYSYSIFQNDCSFASDGIACVDYNGDGGYVNTFCEHDHMFFIGSDCYYAMLMGHCWNELMGVW